MYLIYSPKRRFCQFFVAIESSQLYVVRNPMTEINCSMICNLSETSPRSNAWEIRLKESLNILQPYMMPHKSVRVPQINSHPQTAQALPWHSLP
jgi:hypothetical protein